MADVPGRRAVSFLSRAVGTRDWDSGLGGSGLGLGTRGSGFGVRARRTMKLGFTILLAVSGWVALLAASIVLQPAPAR